MREYVRVRVRVGRVVCLHPSIRPSIFLRPDLTYVGSGIRRCYMGMSCAHADVTAVAVVGQPGEDRRGQDAIGSSVRPGEEGTARAVATCHVRKGEGCGSGRDDYGEWGSSRGWAPQT